ncbi:MAG: bifunctional diaminohydroxyphosphoribosylaminopyrimidine deaminase/5-amino-6-(5-phosphoribosylamino)uracil reductase RibD [Acidobacteria bacterium]|nr:bifunctional diaminohydroxyphosphoribosylaminopyrimidine deaminase/5-amino-6-(5-phosphoribosylamino)uracil reductase RibD [Acidobacteriota bacterium]
MRRALALAEQGRFSVSPNPMVGCVVVRDGNVIAEGWHRRAGDAHAEVDALRSGVDARGATMYVTLEPCAHHGRMPPCADAVVASGVQRVVIAMRDPYDAVDGRGIAKLRDAGIAVEVGLLEAEARRQNEVFVWSVTQKLPFVILKAGMTLDGKLATVTRESQWITAEGSREQSLRLREMYDAILVGGGTVAADNPRLTRRLGIGHAVAGWTRIVLDRDRVVPAHAHVLTDGGKTLHVTEDVDLEQLLRDLHAQGVQSLIVEGGALVHAEFIQRKLWQKMVLFVAPMIVGGGNAPSIFSGEAVTRLTEAYRFRFDRAELLGGDLTITAYP